MVTSVRWMRLQYLEIKLLIVKQIQRRLRRRVGAMLGQHDLIGINLGVTSYSIDLSRVYEKFS